MDQQPNTQEYIKIKLAGLIATLLQAREIEKNKSVEIAGSLAPTILQALNFGTNYHFTEIRLLVIHKEKPVTEFILPAGIFPGSSLPGSRIFLHEEINKQYMPIIAQECWFPYNGGHKSILTAVHVESELDIENIRQKLTTLLGAKEITTSREDNETSEKPT